MEMNLRFNEKFIVIGLRTFHKYLLIKKYLLNSISYNDRDGDVLIFRSGPRNVQEIHIYFYHKIDNGICLEININNSKWYSSKVQSIRISEIFKFFPEYENVDSTLNENNMESKLLEFRSFIDQYMLPILKGEIWIDELLAKVKTEKVE